MEIKERGNMVAGEQKFGKKTYYLKSRHDLKSNANDEQKSWKKKGYLCRIVTYHAAPSGKKRYAVFAIKK